jgi:hypothetical protein
MKISKIFANGCSFTYAGGLHWDDVKEIYKNELNIIIDNHLDYAYPNVIGNILGVDVTNHSVPGGSSNRLVRTTYEYLYQNKDNLEGTFFILEIPPYWRDELYSNELKRTINLTISSIHSYTDITDFANGNPREDLSKIYKDLTNYFYNFIDDDFEKNKMMASFFGLISYIKLLGLDYLIVDSGDFQMYLKNHSLSNDDYNFIWFDKDALCNWMNKNQVLIKHETNGLSKDEHLGIEGNKQVAKRIIDKIYEENKTRIS